MELDHSISIGVKADVVNMQRISHRGRRGRTWYSYHIQINPIDIQVDPRFKMPQTILVDESTYKRFHEGDRLLINIGLGYLNHPWYRSIQADINSF